MPNIEFYRKLIQGALKQGVGSITPIDRGKDGDKFKIVTDGGKEYFAKVKDKGKSVTELPNQEKEILGKVDSAFVVQPIFAESVGNRYLVIQPFISGGDLEDQLRKNGPLSEDQVRILAACLFDVARSLDKVDALHLDIKPANIISAEDGNYYLVDFGASRFLKTIRNEKIYPARRFIPPEVLRYLFNPTDLGLQQLTILSDMYGIGAVLYSAMTGKNLAEFFETSAEILNNTPPPIRSIVPEADPILSDLVHKLISKNASDRYRPDRAIEILNGKPLPIRALPVYLFETKPKGEHKDVIPELNGQGDNCGVYWISGEQPSFGKGIAVNHLLWETPFKGKDKVESALLDQHSFDVTAFVVPGAEMCNPLDTAVLAENIEAIKIATKWKDQMALSKPFLGVIDIDESILMSPELKDIKNAYASTRLDGIILRVLVPSNSASLDHRHLNGIQDFIQPWVKNNAVVYFDGDLSILPLLPHGVHGLIASTYPKLTIMSHRRVKPKRATRPDGIYISRFLSIINTDGVTSLRGNASGKLATNCACAACSENLTKRGKLHQWTRTERRKHFVNVFPQEVEGIKRSSPAAFKKRVENTLSEESRFGHIDFKQGHLRNWIKFL